MPTYVFLVKDENGNTQTVVQITPLTWTEVRTERNRLLAESDWTLMPDSPLSDEAKMLYSTYRQRLRDIPVLFATPDDVVFPPKPEV